MRESKRVRRLAPSDLASNVQGGQLRILLLVRFQCLKKQKKMHGK
eukprot:COSAG05_NODE_143_length_16570_cov_12.041953_7_plen_45_part_00